MGGHGRANYNRSRLADGRQTLSRLRTTIGNTWRKNWPEVHCGLTGGLPGFIFSHSPDPLTQGVPVFCYHVIDEPTFRADLSFLSSNGYTTLTADALLDHLQAREAAPPRSVVLSFDDGQQTLHEVAWPLLKEYGHKAVAFICPGLHREPDHAEADAAGGAAEISGGGLCDWRQIQAMHDSGHIDFQPHTDSHRYIPDWPRPLPLAGVRDDVTDRRRPAEVSLADDLRRAKAQLDQRLNKNCQHMAFPQYHGTDAAVQTARQIGYQGFWWGVLPNRPMNQVGDPPERIVRISGEFVRRLPGENRVGLTSLIKARYGGRLHSA